MNMIEIRTGTTSLVFCIGRLFPKLRRKTTSMKNFFEQYGFFEVVSEK